MNIDGTTVISQPNPPLSNFWVVRKLDFLLNIFSQLTCYTTVQSLLQTESDILLVPKTKIWEQHYLLSRYSGIKSEPQNLLRVAVLAFQECIQSYHTVLYVFGFGGPVTSLYFCWESSSIQRRLVKLSCCEGTHTHTHGERLTDSSFMIIAWSGTPGALNKDAPTFARPTETIVSNDASETSPSISLSRLWGVCVAFWFCTKDKSKLIDWLIDWWKPRWVPPALLLPANVNLFDLEVLQNREPLLKAAAACEDLVLAATILKLVPSPSRMVAPDDDSNI